jgi:NAD-dependent deacetylase
LVIESTGEIMPASLVPQTAKQNGAVIIEINPKETNYTQQITDIHLNRKAGEILTLLGNTLFGIIQLNG